MTKAWEEMEDRLHEEEQAHEATRTALRALLQAIRNASVGKRGLLGQPVHVALRRAEVALGEMVTADEDL